MDVHPPPPAARPPRAGGAWLVAIGLILAVIAIEHPVVVGVILLGIVALSVRSADRIVCLPTCRSVTRGEVRLGG